MISSYLGDGKRFGVNITYSPETNGALETAGGIIQALPLLTENSNNSEPFMLINGDIFTDYSFAEIPRLADNDLAHICLVDNPEHNKNGDFILNNNQLKNIEPIEKSKFKNEITYTFSGISIFRPEFFKGKDPEQILKLGPMIKKAVSQGRVSANLLDCAWTDVGTPERLANLNK
jgi:MurNAc alpha-1-phosphate uridylyltransferase